MRVEAGLVGTRWARMIIAALLLLLATAIPAGPAAPTADATLGRLFMTPAQRSALDAGRAGGGTPAAAAPAAVAARPEQVLLNGVLIRSRGPDTVWINGQATRRGAQEGWVRSAPATNRPVTVAYPGTGTTIQLKPGQVWTPGSGHVTECLGCQESARATAEPAPAGPEAAASRPEEEPAETPATPAPTPAVTSTPEVPAEPAPAPGARS